MGVLPEPPEDLPNLPRQHRTEPEVVITQTILRASTTFTTHVTLGRPPASAFATPVPTPTPLHTDSPAQDRSTALSSGEIGAIIACLVVFAFLVLLGWYCLRRRPAKLPPPPPPPPPRPMSFSDESYFSSDESSLGPVAPEPGPGPGGTGSIQYVREGRGPWARYNVQHDGPMRVAPRRHEISMYEHLTPVYGNVRHVKKPPPGYIVR